MALLGFSHPLWRVILRGRPLHVKLLDGRLFLAVPNHGRAAGRAAVVKLPLHPRLGRHFLGGTLGVAEGSIEPAEGSLSDAEGSGISAARPYPLDPLL